MVHIIGGGLAGSEAAWQAARAGVKVIIQPGGSVRDEETIAACKAAGVTMYLTGTRHFFH